MNAHQLDEWEHHVDHERHAPGFVQIFEQIVAENKRLKVKCLRLMLASSGDLHKIKLMQEENKRMKRALDSAQLNSMFHQNQAG